MSTQSQQSEAISTLDHIKSMLKANIPYIWVTTFEEDRFIESLYGEVLIPLNREVFTWSTHQGLVPYDPELPYARAKGDLETTTHPQKALDAIGDHEIKKGCKGTIFIMKDFHIVLQQPLPRQLRDLYIKLSNQKKCILIVSPMVAHGPMGQKGGIEPTLEKQIVVLPYELPTKAFIEARIVKMLGHLKQQVKDPIKSKIDYTDDEINQFAIALQGLTEQEIAQAMATSMTHLQRLDQKFLLSQKRQIIQRSEILEYIGITPSIDEVGGLDLAKKYFETYKDQFTPEAEEYGVDPLKGVLLTGLPGAGKSLLVKAVASVWHLPLLRLDVGKVMGSLVGSSEERMRQVINSVEAIAPALLWIDEIEKSLSGTKSSNQSDGGTMARVFGTLLTAMEERMKDVVVLATANDIQALPPELIRRFNEIFFVDLPRPEEREEIFRIHLKKRKRDINALDLDVEELVHLTHLYTGAEIEKAVKEGIARAFQNKKKDVSQVELVGAIKDTKPIAKIMSEKINAIREWARDKARYASSLAAAAAAPGAQTVTTSGGTELDLNSDLDNLDEAILTHKEKEKQVSQPRELELEE